MRVWGAGAMMLLTIPGAPVGWRPASLMKNGRGRYMNKAQVAFLEYKRHVQRAMVEAGMASPEATREAPLLVFTRAYFVNGTHPDPENVHKGVKDAIFYASSSLKDKYTGGGYCTPQYDPANPRVELWVGTPGEARELQWHSEGEPLAYPGLFEAYLLGD